MPQNYDAAVEPLEFKAQNARRDYLRAWGWKETCATPGSFWLWKRDFSDYDRKFDAWHAAHPEKPARTPSGVLCVPEDLAVTMTRSVLEEHEEVED